MSLALNSEFEEILEPFGSESANFFLAAALYHSHKLSFSAAAHLANLSFEGFAARLREHFDSGFWLPDDIVLEEIDAARLMHRK